MQRSSPTIQSGTAPNTDRTSVFLSFGDTAELARWTKLLEREGYQVLTSRTLPSHDELMTAETLPALMVVELSRVRFSETWSSETLRRIAVDDQLPLIVTGPADDPVLREGLDRLPHQGFVPQGARPLTCAEAVRTAFRCAAHQHELELKERALESTANGVVFADLDGRVRYTNPAIREMWGYSRPDEVEGRPIYDFVPNQDELMALFQEAVTSGESDGSFTGLRADGSTFPARLFASRVDASGNQPDEVMGSVLDISDQRRTERRLAAYQQAADSAAEMIVAVDTEARYVYANRRFLDTHLLTREQVIGSYAWEILGSEFYADELKEKLNRCLAGRQISFELDREYPRQGLRHMSVAYSPIRRDGEITGAIGVIRDTTEEVRLRNELREKSRELEDFFNLIPDVAGVMNPDGTVNRMNRAGAEIMGGSPEEMQGRLLLDFVHPDDREETLRAIERLRYGEEITGFVNRYRGGDGEYRWLEWRASHSEDGLIYGAARDITARREAQAELLDQRWQLRSVIESATIGTWRWNVEAGELHGNHIAAEMLGYPGEDAAQVALETWEALVHPEDLARSAEMIRRHFAGELPRYDVELRLRHHSGEWIWVHLRGRLMTRSDSGGPLFMFGTMTNATERKQAEARIRELLNEKELLLREMRHRIKNNMNTLVAMLTLQAERSASGETREALAEARRRTSSLAVLYDKLYEAGGDGTISLHDYLGALVTDVVALFPGGERVTVHTAVDEVQMDAATASTLGTIVNELVTNAMKHAFPHGGEGTISLTGRLSPNGMRLEVADDGVGMDPGPVTPGEDSPSGLGLELVSLLTRQLGGIMNVDTDGGTRFVLELPSIQQ